MLTLIFVTHNRHKIREIDHALKAVREVDPAACPIVFKDLDDIGCSEEIAETSMTLEGNALMKARYIHETCHVDCFADDTGLEVEALNGKPGVLSARYAGEEKDSEKNMDKVLAELKNKKNRKAQFRTVIALFLDGKNYLFEGVLKGMIIEEKRGNRGFGYDPVFLPDGYSQTLAEMSLEMKNSISHRAVAIKKLIDFLLKER